MTLTLPILHFNDVYRVKQTSRSLGGTITADQFAAKIARIRESWGERSRALDFLAEEHYSHNHDDQENTSNTANGHHHKREKDDQPLKGLVLFSGDVFNPSIESSVTRGEHMIDVLNACSIDCSCLGNHDFDFGFPHLQSLIKQTNFPWTFTNIADTGHAADSESNDDPKDYDKQVEGTAPYWVYEVNDIRIGCIGLVEKDWIATVPSFPPEFRYRSMIATAKKWSEKLRDPKGQHRCDIIIALSHCRLPNDIDLANALGARKEAGDDEHGVDLVLGGHDHTYYIGSGIDNYEGEDWHTDLPGQEKDKDCMLVKSGTDFHDLSEIQLEISEAKEGAVRRRRIVGAKVVRHSTSPSDPTLPELKEHIDHLMESVDKATGQPVAFTLTPLDCRMGQVRTEESATGNLIADILMHSYEDALKEKVRTGDLKDERKDGRRQVDMTLICGGSLRGDAVFGPGTLALRDVMSIMPFEDSVIVKEMKGQDIWDALESGFGAYPSQEGRFPQVAGLSIVWDSRKPSGKRLVEVCLLEDIHLFHPDGSKKSEDEVEAADTQSYSFERSQEGGYSIDVNRPKISKGEKLEMDKMYRVCTREYMAAGHDGYEALTRGRDIIDHESGSLMSTLVRKFLLGASLIWRLKSFRENADDDGKGIVGHSKLTDRTMKAIKRAHALHLNGQTTPISEQGSEDGYDEPPSKGKIPVSLLGLGGKSRVVIDSSPGGIRDAIHAGSSEHHSQHDAASKAFKGRPRKARSSHQRVGSNNSASFGDVSRDSNMMTTSAEVSSDKAANKDQIQVSDKLHVETADVFSRHLEVSPEDGEVLRQSEANLAIIAPLTDGRMVNLARIESGAKEDKKAK